MKNRLITLSAVAISAVSACSDGPATAPEHSSHDAQPRNSAALVALNNRDLATIRQATSSYLQIGAAMADGFLELSPCVSSQLGRGGMGFHYGIPARMFDDVIDPANPELLNYEPQKDGSMRLGAVEYFVAQDAWDATHSAPPSIGGRAFDFVPLGAVPGLPAHYSLHIWVWRNNSSGMFELFNPQVSCDPNA